MFFIALTGSKSSNSTGTMIGLIAGSISVFVLLAIVSLVYYVLRRNHRNTKLVGVMGIGMTPKSMSIGLGLSEPTRNNEKKWDDGSGGTKKMAKIALCDLKPVSGPGETDSDESMYHELVFGRSSTSGRHRKCENDPIMDGFLKTRKSCASSTVNCSTAVSSSGTPAPLNSFTFGTNLYKSSGLLGMGSSSTTTKNPLAKKTNNDKFKYQRVNHGGDFSGKFFSLIQYTVTPLLVFHSIHQKSITKNLITTPPMSFDFILFVHSTYLFCNVIIDNMTRLEYFTFCFSCKLCLTKNSCSTHQKHST